jgi:PAS domain S-box-containing protein
MLIPAEPNDEKQRIQELHALAVLDTKTDPRFDDIVRLSAHIIGCPISLISLVDVDRQWFKAKVGIDASETPREHSFCAHAIHEDKTLVVEDATCDHRFADNPLVTGEPSIRFYAGHPLTTSEGYRVGTLCAIDRVSRSLSDEQLDMLRRLARQASSLLEQRRNELALRTSKENSQRLFAKIPAVVVSFRGAEHVVEYASSSQVALFRGQQLTGRALLEVQPEAAHNGLLQVLDDVYGSGKTVALRDSVFWLQGAERHYDFLFTPSFGLTGDIDGVMGVIEDITKRKRLEFKVQRLLADKSEQHQKMAEMLEQVPTGLAMLEGDEQRFAFANRMYRDAFLGGRQAAGKAVDEVMEPAFREDARAVFAEVKRSGQPVAGENVEVKRAGPAQPGETRYCSFLCQPTRDRGGEVTDILVAVQDVTEQVRSREKISAQVDALHDERELRERFVAALTHDLRTPLTAASMNAQLLRRKKWDDALVQKMAGRIIGSIGRAENMVRDLLDANRIRAGEGLPVSLAEGTVQALLQVTTEDFELMRGKPVACRDACGPLVTQWDHGAIRRVLENLLNNAFKYGAPGAAVTLEATRARGQVTLSVHNEGPPIPEADQATLFLEHKRTRSAIDSGITGWGIGLMLVKSIAEAHGGHVGVRSQAGAGTTFSVILPIDARRLS